jgi:hypothetical protein
VSSDVISETRKLTKSCRDFWAICFFYEPDRGTDRWGRGMSYA